MGGWEAQEGGDVCIHRADSRGGTAKNNSIVKRSNSNNIFKNLGLNKSSRKALLSSPVTP